MPVALLTRKDFNQVKDTYKGRLNFKLSAVPTGGPEMMNLIPDEDQVLSNMSETPGLDRFNQLNADNPRFLKGLSGCIRTSM